MSNIPLFNTGWSPEQFNTYQLAHSRISMPEIKFDNDNFTEYDGWSRRYKRQQNGGISGMSQSTQNILSGVGSFLGSVSGSDIPEGDKAVREGTRSFIGQLGPWGAAISAASGAVDALGDLTGTNLDTIDLNAAKRAGVKGGAVFNKVMNMLPGNSMLWGIFGGNTNTAYLSSDSMEMASGYSGAISKMHDAQALGNKRMLFGKQKANQFINSANKINETLTDMNIERKRMESNYAPQLYAINNQMIYNGYTPGLTLHKHGGTIPELDEVRSIMQSLQSKKQEIQEPQKFQLGGKMNMIVTGALHARKHNLEELNPNLEGEITKKGIPVVVMNEGGEVQSQQAEVEREEWIIEKSSTEYIEDLYNSYNLAKNKIESDKIATECGKFLVKQLLLNTDDPGKIIKNTI